MRKWAIWVLAVLWLAIIPPFDVWAQTGVRAVVVNEFVNIRIAPAIGAQVIATVQAGYVFEYVTGRSGDSQWLRVEFNGEEGWVNLVPLVVLSGDINTLEVGDPRSIPYGGFDSPRSGSSSATSENVVRVTNGLRVRAGPGQAYPTLANMFANTIVPVFGRTASNSWVQINYQGTLGWVSTRYLDFLNGLQIGSLPIGGIVADAPPIADRTPEDYFDTLRLLLARLDLAQPSLDNIRGKWTDAALSGRLTCRDYPARPSDYNIPVPLLAAYFPTLDPLQRDFNDAMFNLRRAIDLFIETCNLPGINNAVGQATIIGALEIVNLVDRQFASLRERIIPLIPADREPGPDECLFTYRLEQDILKIISVGQVVRQKFTPRDRAVGFCIDLFVGQNIAILGLAIKGSPAPIVALSPFDNPTNFIAIGSAQSGAPQLGVGPVVIQANGRYLLLVYDQGGSGADSEYAIVVVDVPPTGLTSTLIYDPITDTVYLGVPPGQQPSSSSSSVVTTPASNVPGITSPNACPSTAFTCDQLFTCQEAYACYAAGNTTLDPDGNGVPCENLCTPP